MQVVALGQLLYVQALHVHLPPLLLVLGLLGPGLFSVGDASVAWLPPDLLRLSVACVCSSTLVHLAIRYVVCLDS